MHGTGQPEYTRGGYDTRLNMVERKLDYNIIYNVSEWHLSHETLIGGVCTLLDRGSSCNVSSCSAGMRFSLVTPAYF